MSRETRWLELLESTSKGREVRVHSGEVQKGDVFVALPGYKFDGAQFIPSVLERGAEYIVCSYKQNIPSGTDKSKLVKCTDIKAALGELARARYRTGDFDFKLIGITGTNGKTTISYMLEHLLQKAGYKTGVIGTVSYRYPGFEQTANLTTPGCLDTHELLSRMGKQSVDTVLMEVSSHALEQDRIQGLDFDFAVFSNLSREHLDYHQEMEAYFRAKASLFETQYQKRPRAILNMDNSYGQRLAREKNPFWGYTLKNNCTNLKNCLKGEILQSSRNGLELEISLANEKWRITSPLIGEYNASNILAVLAVGFNLGLDKKELGNISNFNSVPGRLERIQNSRNLHIFLDYAHSPDALQNVLSAISELDFAKILVLFGCGGDRDKEKRPYMGKVASELADQIILTSDNPRNEDPGQILQDISNGIEREVPILRELDRRKAIQIAISKLREEDALIIAGKGHENYQQIGEQRIEFNDYCVVRELID